MEAESGRTNKHVFMCFSLMSLIFFMPVVIFLKIQSTSAVLTVPPSCSGFVYPTNPPLHGHEDMRLSLPARAYFYGNRRQGKQKNWETSLWARVSVGRV